MSMRHRVDLSPFLQPELEWDFRLPLVKSINVSGHKCGLVSGVQAGWFLACTRMSQDLVFHVNYLGGDMPTASPSTSRAPVIKSSVGITISCASAGRLYPYHGKPRNTAVYLSGEIEKWDLPELLSRGDTIPVFAFALKDDSRYGVFDLSDKLREHGWRFPPTRCRPRSAGGAEDRCPRGL
ncbi:MAG: pyridoxal-dependent decarboxylase [Candidatus Competibacteraceae bacterium]